MSIPTDAQFFSKTDPSKPDVAFLKNHFYREGRISEEHAIYILEKGTEILRAEPNLLYVDAPVTGTSRICSLCDTACPGTQSLCDTNVVVPSMRRYSWAIREPLSLLSLCAY